LVAIKVSVLVVMGAGEDITGVNGSVPDAMLKELEESNDTVLYERKVRVFAVLGLRPEKV
jgi:hypothetical protein